MHDVIIRSRADGVTELRPKVAPLPPIDRVIVIATVLLVTGAFFVSGVLPAKVALALAASSLAGEVVLAIKALVLHLRRPAAQVLEVASFVDRRRAGGRW